MKDGMFYLYANMACNLMMTACACWLLTDCHFHRLLRACYAFIAAGAVVNLLGMVADLLDYQGISYGHIWPGELVTNFGTGVMLAYGVWRSSRRRRRGKLGETA